MTSPNKQLEKKTIPAPILTIVHIIIALLVGRLLPLPLPFSPIVQWLGLGLTLIGLVLGILALMEFKRMRASLASKKNTSALITTGVYKYSRNPVYLGFVFMLIGLPLNSGNYWGIILAWPLITFINNFVIKWEENYLENRHKEQFASYKSKVRRWL